jgi:hypothetical protein
MAALCASMAETIGRPAQNRNRAFVGGTLLYRRKGKPWFPEDGQQRTVHAVHAAVDQRDLFFDARAR